MENNDKAIMEKAEWCVRVYRWNMEQAIAYARADIAAAAEAEEKLNNAETGRVTLHVYGKEVYLSRVAIPDCGYTVWAVKGDTFSAKKDLKAAGLQWDGEIKAWSTTDRAIALAVCRKF